VGTAQVWGWPCFLSTLARARVSHSAHRLPPHPPPLERSLSTNTIPRFKKLEQDLYVLRRAVGVYERLVRRFTAQTTDYQTLLSTFAEGLYTELDFRNEALNNVRMQQLMSEATFVQSDGVVIPLPLMDMTSRCVMMMGEAASIFFSCFYMRASACTAAPFLRTSRAWYANIPEMLAAQSATHTAPVLTRPLTLNNPQHTRRVLTMEWIEGVKLTTLAPDEIRDLVKVGQEAFLIQLLEVCGEEEGGKGAQTRIFDVGCFFARGLTTAPRPHPPSFSAPTSHRSASSTAIHTQVSSKWRKDDRAGCAQGETKNADMGGEVRTRPSCLARAVFVLRTWLPPTLRMLRTCPHHRRTLTRLPSHPNQATC